MEKGGCADHNVQSRNDRHRAKEVQGLQVVKNKAARVGLRVNKYAPTETLRGEMGLSTFEERVDKAKAKYKMRLEMIEENRWPQESCSGPILRAKL